MGLWSNGTPLSWEEAKKHADHVRKHGIKQSLAIYRKLKDRQNDSLLWGDEVGGQPFLTITSLSGLTVSPDISL